MEDIQKWQSLHNLLRGAGKKARRLCRDGEVPGATQPGGFRTPWHLTEDGFAYLNQRYDEGYFDEFKTDEELGDDFLPI
ncbi:MAG: hypothetical protein GY797_37215 [Deltaproteobacteria bacterium]|nr:hypothetical protein [Deltaproteobacteria bacterium]